MNNKGLVMSQIIILVMVVMVISLLVYLLYSNLAGTENSLTAENCKASAISECVTCVVSLDRSECSFQKTNYDGSLTDLGICQDQGRLFLIGDRLDCTKYLGPSIRNANNPNN